MSVSLLVAVVLLACLGCASLTYLGVRRVAGGRAAAVVAAAALVVAAGLPAGAAIRVAAPTGSSAPAEVRATAMAGAASLTWTAPTTPGLTVTQYAVQYSTTGGSTWTGARRTGTRSTTFTYTGLANGRSYVFRVRAVGTSATGAWSAASNATTPTVAPAPVPTSPPPTTSPTPSASGGSSWRPELGTTWQWQLSGTTDTSVAAAVFDIDGEQSTAATVSALHAQGAHVICYFDAGGWESYREDASAFPASVLGNAMDGWPDERWLDVRALSILLPLMEQRVKSCKAKGFDAVEPDVVDGYTNATGFPLTAADQLAYNRALADLAHRYGLGVALKNDPEQVSALQPAFDFAIVEECVQYAECSSYSPFVTAGKAVLHVEYKGTTASFCPVTAPLGFSSMKKRLALDSWREVCP